MCGRHILTPARNVNAYPGLRGLPEDRTSRELGGSGGMRDNVRPWIAASGFPRRETLRLMVRNVKVEIYTNIYNASSRISCFYGTDDRDEFRRINGLTVTKVRLYYKNKFACKTLSNEKIKMDIHFRTYN